MSFLFSVIWQNRHRGTVGTWGCYSMICKVCLGGLAGWTVCVLLGVQTLFSQVSVCSAISEGVRAGWLRGLNIVVRMSSYRLCVLALSSKAAVSTLAHPLERKLRPRRVGVGPLGTRSLACLRQWSGLP